MTRPLVWASLCSGARCELDDVVVRTPKHAVHKFAHDPATGSLVEPHRLMVASDDRKSDGRVGARTEEADHVSKQDFADPAPLEFRVDVQMHDFSGVLHHFMSTGTGMSKPNKSPVALGDEREPLLGVTLQESVPMMPSLRFVQRVIGGGRCEKPVCVSPDADVQLGQSVSVTGRCNSIPQVLALARHCSSVTHALNIRPICRCLLRRSAPTLARDRRIFLEKDNRIDPLLGTRTPTKKRSDKKQHPQRRHRSFQAANARPGLSYVPRQAFRPKEPRRRIT